MRICAWLFAALIVAGCADERAGKMPNRPSAYHPELFPDIPLPPQYVLDPERDQLAVAYAGGSIRRFEVSMIQKQYAEPQRPTEVLALYTNWLPRWGWKSVSLKSEEQRWRKTAEDGKSEELLVEAGRSGSRTTIQFHLRPL